MYYILSAENFVFIDFLAFKVDGSDVYPGICLYENLFTDSWLDVTSVKKVYEDEIFGRQDILQFFSGEFKDYKHVKFPQTLGALKILCKHVYLDGLV